MHKNAGKDALWYVLLFVNTAAIYTVTHKATFFCFDVWTIIHLCGHCGWVKWKKITNNNIKASLYIILVSKQKGTPTREIYCLMHNGSVEVRQSCTSEGNMQRTMRRSKCIEEHDHTRAHALGPRIAVVSSRPPGASSLSLGPQHWLILAIPCRAKSWGSHFGGSDSSRVWLAKFW